MARDFTFPSPEAQPIAYCGKPPVPEDIAFAWNFDPFLLAALGVFIYCIIRHAKSPSLAWAAFALSVLIFVSPLCALSSALFSARVIHHVVLIGMIAPLVAAAFPQIAPKRLALPAGIVFMLHMVALWIWHAPAPYGWALATVAGYWLMQVSLFITALLLWQTVWMNGKGTAIMLLLGTVAQMGLLGALIVFAPEPLYAAHSGTTEFWGLSQLADQQLAGLIMWLPAILPYFIAAMIIGRKYLHEDQPA